MAELWPSRVRVRIPWRWSFCSNRAFRVRQLGAGSPPQQQQQAICGLPTTSVGLLYNLKDFKHHVGEAWSHFEAF